MKALGAIAEFLPIAVAVLLIAHIIRKNPQEPHEDEPPILPPEDWPEEYVREVEEALRRDSQARQKKRERRRKP